jgi:hypothetical protein
MMPIQAKQHNPLQKIRQVGDSGLGENLQMMNHQNQ